MNTFWKTISIATVVMILSGITYGIAHAVIDGNYLVNASWVNIGFIILAYVAMVYLGIHIIKNIATGKFVLVIALLAVVLESCQYAKSNQQVVVSEDCGMNWKKINAGDAVPRAGMNMCYMKVVMPNYPMQGDSRFISNLKDKVRAAVHIDYDYSITEPLAFIKQAKYLGKANANADDDGALDPKAFEGAENMVIDKRIRDVAKSLFILEDIVELDQAELENTLLLESNKVLEPLGVHLNFITLTFDLDEQTRQAIDVSTAMKIYQSKGIIEVGKDVMINRAGAPKITVEVKSEQPPTE